MPVKLTARIGNQERALNHVFFVRVDQLAVARHVACFGICQSKYLFKTDLHSATKTPRGCLRPCLMAFCTVGENAGGLVSDR